MGCGRVRRSLERLICVPSWRSTRVNLTKWLSAGERLSYGLNYELTCPGRVLTVPVGYADGYDRRLSNRGEILLQGRRYPVSGTVCMDQFMVDAGDTSVREGDIATLIGSDGDERISAEEIAAQIDTINYEVTARIPFARPAHLSGRAT